MKSVCAWCNVLLSGEQSDPVTSHGICEDCFKAERLRWAEFSDQAADMLRVCRNKVGPQLGARIDELLKPAAGVVDLWARR